MAKNTKSDGRSKKTAARVRPTGGRSRERQRVKPAPASAARRRSPRTGGAGPEVPVANPAGFTFHANPTLTLVCIPNGSPALFPLEDAAHLTGVHPELLRYYCRSGLLPTRHGVVESDLLFDEAALLEIRRIEHYRRHLGAGRQALPLICALRREGERRQIELHFLRFP